MSRSRAATREFVVLLLALAGHAVVTAAEPSKFLSGSSFRKALEQTVSGNWDNVGLRSLLRSVEEARHVAILPDRRLDPTASLRVSAGGELLGDFLERLPAG